MSVFFSIKSERMCMPEQGRSVPEDRRMSETALKMLIQERRGSPQCFINVQDAEVPRKSGLTANSLFARTAKQRILSPDLSISISNGGTVCMPA